MTLNSREHECTDTFSDLFKIRIGKGLNYFDYFILSAQRYKTWCLARTFVCHFIIYKKLGKNNKQTKNPTLHIISFSDGTCAIYAESL